MKIYKGLDEASIYEVNLNKICRTQKFKDFISEKHKVCPNGLTISCNESSKTGALSFTPEIKYYGYEHIHNNGMEYSDMGDYRNGPAVSTEMAETVLEYFKLNEPWLYEAMKDRFVY